MKIYIAIFVLFIGILSPLIHLKTTFADTVANITISPNTTTSQNQTFILNVTITNVVDMYGWEAYLYYSKIINLTAMNVNTTFFQASSVIFRQNNYNYSYYEAYICGYKTGVTGDSGSGLVAQLTFEADNSGTATLYCNNCDLMDSNGNDIPVITTMPTITVIGGSILYPIYVAPTSYGSLNVSSGWYPNGTVLTATATADTGRFTTFTLDNVDYTTPTIHIYMNESHSLSATFTVPTLTITVIPEDSVILVNQTVYSYTGTLSEQFSIGTYVISVYAPFTLYYKSNTTTVYLYNDTNIVISLSPAFKGTTWNPIPQSSLMTFDHDIWYNDLGSNLYYIDMDYLISAELCSNVNGSVKFIVAYNTTYPVIEIRSSNIAVIKFNITDLYDHYAHESYINDIQSSNFTGFKISTDVPLTLLIDMPQEPKELWKLKESDTTVAASTKMNNWIWADGLLTITINPGDLSTISVLFYSTLEHTRDINGDGKVDGKDIALVGLSFGSCGPDYLYPGSLPYPRWNLDCDINGDSRIDGKDLVLVALNFGK